MIYDALSRARRYENCETLFQQAFDYLQKTDLHSLKPGRYEVDGDDICVLIQELELKPWGEGRWEAHRTYADIQLVIEGTECIGFRSCDGLTPETPYDSENDIIFYPANASGGVICLNADEMMILFPQDCHRPGILPEAGSHRVRKAVAKVRLDKSSK